jgi:hypothetical protein
MGHPACQAIARGAMRSRIACGLIALAIAACSPPSDQAPVKDPKEVAAAAAAAAAESARVAAARAAPKPLGPLSLAISGSEHYESDSGFEVTCVSSESRGERLLQIEALGRNARINFTIYNPRDGDAPVGNNYTRSRAKTRVGNLEVSVGTHNYADGRGQAAMTDLLGRSGHLHASGFIKMGVSKKASHRASLNVRVRWECE